MGRTLRVLCSDPDATDSSSDEEGEFAFGVPRRRRPAKTIVVEVCLPGFESIVAGAPPAKNGSDSRGGGGKVRKAAGTAGRGSSGLKGIRLRKWGKWAAEIRDPIRGKRMWLGTFSTPEEAYAVYCKAELRFKEELAEADLARSSPATIPPAPPLLESPSVSSSSSADPGTPHPFTATSPSSVLDATLPPPPPEVPKHPPPPPAPTPPPPDDFSFPFNPFLKFDTEDLAAFDVGCFLADDLAGLVGGTDEPCPVAAFEDDDLSAILPIDDFPDTDLRLDGFDGFDVDSLLDDVDGCGLFDVEADPAVFVRSN